MRPFESSSPILSLLPLLLCLSCQSVFSRQSNASSCHKHSLKVPDTVTTRSPVLAIAHRGSSYHLPEHTLAAYRLALELGADYIEPDLVVTSDAVLIALHTVDLNVTTNVHDVFGAAGRDPWYSDVAGKAGYWTFNFTWEEIQQLTVRQRLPASRSTAYDGLFGIPSLADILNLLHTWNTVDLLARFPMDDDDRGEANDVEDPQHPTPHQKYQSGVYIEFKEVEWFKKEAGMDPVDLLYQSIRKAFDDKTKHANSDHTDSAYYWRHLLPCFSTVRFDEYIVPGLVLQSFDARDLEDFHSKWQGGEDDNDDDSALGMKSMAAEPPYILLADKRTCLDESFLFQLGGKWRSFLSGVGSDKECVLGETGALFVEKVAEFSLVLHPWTERPEREYVASQFQSNEEEIRHLICHIHGVHGIFTESVDTVVRLAAQGCDTPPLEFAMNGNETDDTPKASTVCHERRESTNVYVGILSFVVGGIIALMARFVIQTCKRARVYATDSTRVPTDEEEIQIRQNSAAMT